MSNPTIIRDERTVAVENASYRWAYLLLSFGILASVAYRGFVRNESSWDLLALVIGSGLVATFYQTNHQILTRRWALWGVGAMLLAVVIAFALVLWR